MAECGQDSKVGGRTLALLRSVLAYHHGLLVRKKMSRYTPSLVMVGLLVVLVITALSLKAVIASQVKVDATNPIAAMVQAHRAAIVWAASFLVFVAVAMWNVVVTTVIVRRYLPNLVWRIVGLWVVALAVIGFKLNETYAGVEKHTPLALVYAAGVHVYNVTAVGNGIAATAITLFIASACALLYRRSSKMTVRALRERIELTRLSLYSAAALLVVGVAEIYFLNVWPAYFQSPKYPVVDPDALRDVAYSVAIAAGVIYSTVLIALYVPVIVLQESWVSREMERRAVTTPNSNLKDWREAHALDHSVVSTLVQIGAVVGPWLAAIGVPKLLFGP